MYRLPENPTREDVRREYIIVNMKFKELRVRMEPRNRNRVSDLLGYVRDELKQNPNPEDVLPDHTSMSLILAEGIISKYRGETAIDVRTARNFVTDLDQRFYALREDPLFRGSKIFNRLGDAIDALDNVDYQRPEIVTKAIDKAMFHLGEAEKLILEAEQKKPAEVEV